MKIILLTLLFSSFAQGWTLNNNFGAAFKDNNVKVYIDYDTECSANRITADELADIVKNAVKFWNRVPTANLNLTAAGFSPATQNINDGRLCSPTDDACIIAGNADGNLIPAVNNIIIACNAFQANFGGSNVLAVTIPNKFSGSKIVGAIILINEDSNAFGSLSRSDQIGVIAHEIGHAIGLGHSEDTAALMYYRIMNQRKRLGQDDIDGVSFLYPMRGDLYGLSENGLLGACGTIGKNNPPGNPPLMQMGITLGLLILLFEIYRLFNRTKARPAT